MTIEMIFEDPRWPEYMGELASQVEENIFDHFSLDVDDYEATILFTDDAAIKTLNNEFRGKDQPTNILSWPSLTFSYDQRGYPNPPPVSTGPFPTVLGDMAMAYETCFAEAARIGELPHFTHLMLHGYLHLMGYDHIEDRDAVIMQAIEIEILTRMNITNPYQES